MHLACGGRNQVQEAEIVSWFVCVALPADVLSGVIYLRR